MESTQMEITSAERSTLLSRQGLPPDNLGTTKKLHSFEIHDVKCSENALLLFNNKFVFKILRPYKDHRYSQEKRFERRACLLEGWRWNRLFTRGIHLGLARLYSFGSEQDKLSPIVLGDFLNPDEEPLDTDAEYVLVMRKLPKIQRLDVLLRESNNASRQHYATILTAFLAHIHASLAFPLDESGGDKYWGSITQLKEKLEHNLVSVEEPDITNKAILETCPYQSLRSTCEVLRESLLPIFTNKEFKVFQLYFTRRVEKEQIKRCHGDLKSRNIWIMPTSNQLGSKYLELWSGVRVLDAVDFNPEFCNIDTLSDFAMLVADIHARTDSLGLANSMIEGYLRLTKQEDKGSKFVLNYYLIEKAFVGALVSILYDKNLWLGQRYLVVCDRYLTELKTNLPHTLQTAPMLAHHK